MMKFSRSEQVQWNYDTMERVFLEEINFEIGHLYVKGCDLLSPLKEISKSYGSISQV